MKTPKRDIMPLFQLVGGHRLYKGKEHEYFRLGFFPTTVSRWKRKNRIRQLKSTIARQAEEIEHLRTALAIRAASEYNESIRASIEYVQKHFSMEISQPRMEMEDSFMVYKWKRPIPRWDNSIIDFLLPEDKQP